VEPRIKLLSVSLAPQPRQMPPPPFDRDELQRIFADVIRVYPYQSFNFTPNGRGAVFSNGPGDAVELRPAQLQIDAKMDGPDLLTAPMASAKVAKIFKAASERLKVEAFLQCRVHVIASVNIPEGDAKKFVAERLQHDVEQAAELGPDYFAGGVRFRRLMPPQGGEENLTVEPDVNDNSQLYVEFDTVRGAIGGPIMLEQVSSWVDEALEFVAGPTIRLLSR
jgi:hypothetical protein